MAGESRKPFCRLADAVDWKAERDVSLGVDVEHGGPEDAAEVACAGPDGGQGAALEMDDAVFEVVEGRVAAD